MNVIPDTTPPTLVSVIYSCASNLIRIFFSEQVDAVTAGDAANYQLDSPVSFQSVTLAADGQSVLLSIGPLNPGVSYTLTVDNVRDLAGNTIAPGSMIGFSCPELSYNITVPVGFSLIANQLDQGSNTLNEIIPNAPPGTRLSKFDNSSQSYSISTFDGTDFVWKPGNITLQPGEGAYLETPSAFTLTFSGVPHRPVLPVLLGSACYLLSRQTNDVGNYENITGQPPPPGAQVFKLAGGSFQLFTYDEFDLRWIPDEPLANIGEPLWICPSGGAPPAPPMPPAITVQPISLTATQGSDVVFTVTVTGTPPLSFQWFRGTNAIARATNSTLTIGKVQVTDADDYSIRVSNSFGSVTSTNVTLGVLDSYSLDLPAGLSLIANQLHTAHNFLSEIFPAVPDGAVIYKFNGLSYDISDFIAGVGWSADFVLAPGDGAFIQLPVAMTLSFKGEYRAPRLPKILSAVFNLVSRQIPAPAGYEDIIGLPPVEGTVVYQYDPALGDYRVQVFAGGQWRDHAPLAGVGESLFIRHIALPAIEVQPVGQTNISPGTSVMFSFAASGDPPFRYQWRRNGVNILNETNATLTILNAQVTNNGIYSVVVQSALIPLNLPTEVGKKPEDDVPGAASGVPVALKVLGNDGFPFADEFAFSAVIGFSRGSLVGNNDAATGPELGEPNHADKRSSHSVWLTWRAPADGIVTFSTAGSAFDTVLAAYSGNDVAALSELAGDDDSGGYLNSRISFNVTNGQSYHIAIAGFGQSESGDFVLSWNLEPTSERLPVIDPAGHPQTRIVALGDPVEFAVTASGSSGLVYQWFVDGRLIAGANQSNYTIAAVTEANLGAYQVRVSNASNPGRFVDSRMALLQAHSGAPPLMALADAAGVRDDVSDPLSFAVDKLEDAVAGLLVGGPVAFSRAAARPRSLFPPPAHGYTDTPTFSTTLGGKDRGEPNHCGVTGGASYWYPYQPPADGTLFLTTDGSSYDTVLAVYVGPGTSYATLTNVACNHDGGANGKTSRLNLPAKASTVYFIVVDGENTPKSGLVKLNYRLIRAVSFSSLHYAGTNSGRLSFTVNCTPNVDAILQVSTNLASASWVSLSTNRVASGTFTYTNLNSAISPKRFYRVVNRF